MKNQQAYTLIEILIALFIIAIIFSFSVLDFQNFYKQAQDDFLQVQLLESIEVAQHESRIRRMPIALCSSNNQKNCSGEWQDGLLVFMNESKDGVVRGADQIIATFKNSFKHGKLHWRAFPFYRNYLLFLPNHQINVDNSLFWLCHHHHAQPIWALAISKSGRTRTILPDREGVIRDAHGKVLSCEMS